MHVFHQCQPSLASRQKYTMIARPTTAMSGNSSALPWNGIQVPIWSSAVSGLLSSMPRSARWPPPAAPVAKSDGDHDDEKRNDERGHERALVLRVRPPSTRGRMPSRPIAKR